MRFAAQPPSLLSRLVDRMTLVLLLAIVATPAYAYLDPTSGSMILQLLLGGVAGLIVALKLFWHKITGFFSPKKRQHDEPSA